MKKTLTSTLALALASICAYAQEKDMAQYMPTLEMGSEAPEFAVPSQDGDTIRLSDYRGKYLVIDFWASWCGDCRREFQEVKKLYAELHPQGVEFLSISFDHEQSSWTSCLEKEQFPWPQVCNLVKWKENPISKAYGLHWIPTLYLISPDGTVAGYALTAAAMKNVWSKQK